MRHRVVTTRRVLLVLAAAIVTVLATVGQPPSPAQALTQYSIGQEFSESGLADGYDYLMEWSGSGWVQSSPRSGLGTLSTNTAAADPMVASGLTLLKTICLHWSGNVNVQGRHCFRKYRPNNDGSATYKYFVWWVTGSTAAKSGRRLLAVRDGMTTDSTNAWLIDWRPTGTTSAGSCHQISVGMSLGAYGISASISTTFTVCPETFGPSYVGTRLFRFRWDGNRGANNWVGSGGGGLYEVLQSASPTFKVGVVAWYCKTSESGC